MQFTRNAKGFTLIELLVVITIIGILAVGGTTVYTSQIQKSRDSVRITAVENLKGGIEQVYQDKTSYPTGNSFSGDIAPYVPRLPQDPKTGNACNGSTPCDYLYVVGDDANGLQNSTYEVSTGFESTGNKDSKAADAKDGGNDELRWENGLDVATLDTTHSGAITSASGSSCKEVSSGGPVVISGPCAP